MSVDPMGPVTVSEITTNSAYLEWARPAGADNFLIQVEDAETAILIQAYSPPHAFQSIINMPVGRRLRVTITPTSNDPEIPPGDASVVEFCTRLQSPTIQQMEIRTEDGYSAVALNVQVFIPPPGALLRFFRNGELVMTVPLGDANGWTGTFSDRGENCQGLLPGMYSYRVDLLNAAGATSELSNELSIVVEQA